MGNGENFESKKRQLSQSLLKEEILQLEKELKEQTVVRSALEKAMNRQLLLDDPDCKSLSQPAEDLIKEIALLELEVICLEKYLLSLYRRTFAKRLSTLPTTDKTPRTDVETHNSMPPQLPKTNLESVNEDSVIRCSSSAPHDDSSDVLPVRSNDVLGADTLIDSGIYRSQSSLSHHSACSFRHSPPFEALDAYHSLPLSMLERTQESTSYANPQDYRGSSCCVRETPNWLSEEMIRCISTIYCHLSDPPLSCEENSWLDNPFHFEQSKEVSGTFFEVNSILRDRERLNAVQDLLQNYRSLISRLAQVDPAKLKHDEKLAFWINVHNALVMHAAYNIGGHTISVDTIQSSILRCRLPRPTQWLHSLFFPKTKFKAGDPRKSYALKHPEPRLHFALCSGCQSDPPVRLYKHKKVFQELEIAKEEYIQMNTKLHKEQKLLIPKNVDYFIKEMSLSPSGIAEMLEHSMPQSVGKNFQQLKQKLWKKVDWIPHNFTFRFRLSHELVR